MMPNYIKRDMYASTIKGLNKALKEEFFFEAIMREYALIEDRINEILFYSGIVNRVQSGLKVTNKARKPLRELLNLKDNAKFGINNLQTRISILRQLAGETQFTSDYFAYLNGFIETRVDTEEILSLLCEIEAWKDDRNGYVHGLMDKVPYDIDDALRTLAENGYKLFRRLDNVSRKFIKCNARKKFGIQ